MLDSRPARAELVPARRELTRVSIPNCWTMIAAKAEMTEEDGASGARAGGETQGHATKPRRG